MQYGRVWPMFYELRNVGLYSMYRALVKNILHFCRIIRAVPLELLQFTQGLIPRLTRNHSTHYTLAGVILLGALVVKIDLSLTNLPCSLVRFLRISCV